MENETGKKKLGRSKRTPLDVLRTKLWFGWLRRQINYGKLSKTVTALNNKIDKSSERLLYKYAKGQVSPTGLNLGYLETCYPGSRAVFENGFCNLFPILEARSIKEAARLLMDAVALEHESMPDHMCFGDTTLEWLLNISPVLTERALQEKRLLDLALVAAICESRFLDKTTNLSKVAEPAVVKLCQSYPGLKREDIVATLPEVAEALERNKLMERILISEPFTPQEESDAHFEVMASLLADYSKQSERLNPRLQYVKFLQLMGNINKQVVSHSPI
jgi:hypothetical protein